MSSSASPWTTARLIAGLIVLTVAGSLWANSPSLTANQEIDSTATYSSADENGRFTYMIEFVEPSLLQQHQERSSGEFNYQSPATLAARDQLMGIQAQHVSRIGQTVGRSVAPSHHYLATRNGIAARLSPTEAERVASMAEVKAIQRERVFELSTFRGPEFIGASSIWDGSAVPGGTPYLGELMIAAILDSGIPDPASHPSFANDPSCGHGEAGVPDKVISLVDCTTTDGAGLCNGPDPIDENGHGSHTASTVAGNFVDNSADPSPGLPAPFTAISGVAPCAHIRSYDVCSINGGSSCGGADIAGGLESVLFDNGASEGPISAMNYSISGGSSPWTDFDRTKLDLVDAGVFVAASAGNTSATVTNPVGAVNHRGPWVMSVAASTHDGQIGKSVSLDGGPSDIFAIEGTGPAMVADFVGDLRFAGDVDAANVEGCVAFPASAFDGEAALISRGSCSFSVKVDNAVAAGAAFVIVYNNVGAPIVMGGLPGTAVSSVMVSTDDGNALIAALGGDVAEVTVLAADSGFIVPEAGDILAGFSLRGPTASPLQDLQKPNITAPGVNILAGVPGGYGFLSGTSMSGPHVAGAGVLVRQANPDWTVSEVKSAMQMTAFKGGTKEDGSTPWDWDDVGHGRVDLTKAALAGLVMDESFANYLAANPSTGGDVKTLNTPDVRNLNCTPSCTFERTLRNTLDVASSWTVTPDSFNPDLDIQVTPAGFVFTGDTSETVTLTITATPNANLTGAIEFGQILFSEAEELAPEAHMTVAISGTNLADQEIAVSPADISEVLGVGFSTSVDVDIANVGDVDLNWSMEFFSTTSNRGTLDVIWDQPTDGTGGIISDEFLGSPAGDVVVLSANDFDINAAQEITEIFVPGFWNGGNINTAVALNWEIYADDNGVPAGGPTGGDAPLWSYSAAPGDTGVTLNNNRVTLDVEAATASGINLPTGRHWLVFYPTINFGADFNARWNWAQGTPALGTSHLIDPANLFGVGATDWTPQTAIGVPWPDTAFTLSGRTNCEATPPSWLSVDTTAGTVSGGEADTVSVTLDATGLAIGTYDASLCITSDDPVNPLVFVPVALEVIDPADLPQIEVAPASVSVGVDVLDPTGSDSIDISNLGNDLDLEWSIEEAEAAASVGSFRFPTNSTRGGFGAVLGTLDGSVALSAADLASLPRSTRGTPPALSVDGNTANGAYNSGDPNNSSLIINIGVGNQLIGIGWEVSVEAFAPSWLSEAAVAIVPNAGDPTGLFLTPVPGTDGPGVETASSEGILLFDDAGIAPIPANAAGELYFEWHEGFNDGAVDPDSQWSDSASPITLLPGLTLVCTDQAACDAAVGGGPGPDVCDAPSDIPWLSVTPASGTTVSGDTSPVSVDFDATGLAPGTYDATLCVRSNDPATPLVEVPVSMEVAVPANAALIEGTVQGLGYCQADPILAAGAGIEIVGALETFSLTADGDGFFSVYLDDANGPVDVTASAPNHITDTQVGIAIAGQTTTVVDFGLVLELPCAQVAPASFSEVFGPGDGAANYGLTIDNALGGAQLVWGIQESEPTVVYGYGLEGAGELVNNTGGARDSNTLASERGASQSPFVDAGIQGAPIAANFTEGFEDITLLAGAGWSLQNLSAPLGTTDWFQGSPVTFPAHQGDPDAYIGANFNNTAGGTGIISNWLMTPEVELRNGTELRFWTRVPSNAFPDRLEVRLSTSGSSTFAGAAATDVGDFDTLLLSIDENLVGNYPVEWTEYVVEVSGLAETTSGRLAFRYFVTDAGPAGTNSNYIGIDTVSLAQPNFCENPADVPWLSVSPFFGAADAGDSSSVDVSVDPAGLEAGAYNAFICVNSNDAETPLIQVPFSIEVLGDDVFADRFEG